VALIKDKFLVHRHLLKNTTLFMALMFHWTRTVTTFTSIP